MFPYFFIYVSSFLVSIFKNRKNQNFVCILLVILLGLFAGTRNPGIDNDYFLYKFYFDTSIKGGYLELKTELCIYIIPNVVSWFTDNYVNISLLFFAFISLSLKIFSIKDYKYFGLAIMLYVSNLFFMQDMTTIRASVSSGVLLWSLKDLIAKNDKRFFLKLGFAILFHYSSIIFIIIWLVNKFGVKYKWLFVALFLSILVPVLDLNFISILHLDALSHKAEIYMKIKEYEEEKLNLFNFKILISLFYLVVLYWNRNKIVLPSFDLIIKIHILSLFFFFFFSTTGLTFSQRTFELLSIVQIVLFPTIIMCFNSKLKLFGYLIVLATSGVFFYYNIYISEIFKEYTSWLF